MVSGEAFDRILGSAGIKYSESEGIIEMTENRDRDTHTVSQFEAKILCTHTWH